MYSCRFCFDYFVNFTCFSPLTMDLNKLIKFNNIEYIHAFSVNSILIHKLEAEMDNNWLKFILRLEFFFDQLDFQHFCGTLQWSHTHFNISKSIGIKLK